MKSAAEQSGMAQGEFGVCRDHVLELLAPLDRIAETRRERSSQLACEELRAKLRDSQFHLAVLGQFKRGKSTLLNSLLGADVLPVSVVPATSVVTFLVHGDRPDVQVLFLSGEERSVPVEQISDYVTERGNPGNAREVKHVEVCYPSRYLRDGVRLVDTPGVGSTYEHNTEVTRAFLAQVDAAIVLLGVDPPLTQVEADFLRKAKEDVHHFFFVLNKVDLMSTAEARESLEFTAAQIEDKAGLRGCQLFPLSAREALEAKKTGDERRLNASGLPAFERALRRFLLDDKGRVLLHSALAEAQRIADGLRFTLELEHKAAAEPLQELERKEAALAAQLQQVQQDREDMNVLLTHEAARCIERVEADLREHIEAALPESLQRLEQFVAAHPDAGRAELGCLLDRFLASEVEAVFQQWRRAEDRRMEQRFAEVSGRFAEKANSILQQIRGIVAGLFDLPATGLAAPAAFSAGSRVYYKTDPLFQFALDMAPFVLPRSLFRRQVLKKMREQVRSELDRNSGRIRFDYLERIEKSVEEFRALLNRRIDALLEGVRLALERSRERRRLTEAGQAGLATEQQIQVGELQAVLAACQAIAGELAEGGESACAG